MRKDECLGNLSLPIDHCLKKDSQETIFLIKRLGDKIHLQRAKTGST